MNLILLEKLAVSMLDTSNLSVDFRGDIRVYRSVAIMQYQLIPKLQQILVNSGE